MQRVWVERIIVLTVVAFLVGLAPVLGVWSAVFVALAMLAGLAVIILVGAGTGPPPDQDTFV